MQPDQPTPATALAKHLCELDGCSDPAPCPDHLSIAGAALKFLANATQADVDAAYKRGKTEGRGDSYTIGVNRGFVVAVDALRDDARYDQWWSALPQEHPDYGYWSQHPRRQFADYLEAVGPWEPAEGGSDA